MWIGEELYTTGNQVWGVDKKLESFVVGTQEQIESYMRGDEIDAQLTSNLERAGIDASLRRYQGATAKAEGKGTTLSASDYNYKALRGRKGSGMATRVRKNVYQKRG